MIPHALSLADLRAVAAVADARHFGRAAQSLHIAQPTLSAQVRKVEEVLGARLFERGARRFLITAEGNRLLPLVRDTLAAAGHLGAAAQSPGAGASPLRLGVIPTLGPYYMPYLLLPLRRARPGLTLNITEQPTAVLLEMLRSGELDAALLSLPVAPHTLNVAALFDEPFRLIAPRTSDIASCTPLTPARLDSAEMILLEEGHCLRDQALAACGERSRPAQTVATGLETLKYLVASGAGYSLMPALACEIPRGLASLIALRDFDGDTPSRRIALCTRRTMPRTEDVESLLSFIRERTPPGVTPAPRAAARPRGPARHA